MNGVFLRVLCQVHISGSCLNLSVNLLEHTFRKVVQSKTAFLWEIIHTGPAKNAGLTMQAHSNTGPSVCWAFMSWEFLQSSRQTALTTMKRPVKPTPAKKAKTAQADCWCAFVSPRLRARDENGPVKQLVTCLSKKNVKRRPRKQIRASVGSTLTQFLAF